ncbi:hypothetical protein A9K55_003702 [Cordyceps militaris]|uniref:Uncharacterized protein n=1 Tax=Cordyceps militaris TaxID=73501 RepID=A0A2H4S6H5_CORMI|nr:hypothetical protein A9K55_003702 [Cordyceps militaris]
MGDEEMSQEPPVDRGLLALKHLDAAYEARKQMPDGKEQTEVVLAHATQALRLADDDRIIKALANLVLGGCHEQQDKWHLAYYEYVAAKEQYTDEWTESMEQALQYCRCKVFPR